ncbi:MAG: GNAT family N-acetyltransferase [Candidatus Binatus sp.]|uniref:GNAT family N-acetyltransferase n=1 Tax=Candidatus Binatus sp. TaxID=2811406 RepID=UPI002715C3C8|nr:GNAT family N-acetyltransferase [Candidatus Binatus sp.]MDO8432151.1 GNAT family N-acetyltransferase [Candidatus Binatus sp.]
MSPIDARTYRVEATLRDGGAICIRAIRPDDKARLLEHFAGLSPQSVYFRFMGIRRELSERDLKDLTELDFINHVGLVATITEGGVERLVGVGRYIRGAHPERAELAFAILDKHQGRGIGTLLLEHLNHIAHANGITEFEANVLGDNTRMLEVFAHSGLKVRRSFESGVVHLYFSTDEPGESSGE